MSLEWWQLRSREENEAEELEAERGAALGDPRRCPVHPHVATSSPDGMFDTPCYECEGEMALQAEQDAWEALPAEERARIEAENEEAERERIFQQQLAEADDIPF